MFLSEPTVTSDPPVTENAVNDDPTVIELTATEPTVTGDPSIIETVVIHDPAVTEPTVTKDANEGMEILILPFDLAALCLVESS